MSKKRKRAPSRSRGEWVEIIKAWKDSGLTAAQFADEQGLRASSLAKWQWRLRKQQKRYYAGATPSQLAFDGRRVLVQLRGAADPESGGQYTLKRLKVTKHDADGNPEEIELRP